MAKAGDTKHDTKNDNTYYKTSIDNLDTKYDTKSVTDKCDFKIINYELDTKGFIKISDISAEQRKQLHIWAKSKDYIHAGYVDKKYRTEEFTQYKCRKCNEWRQEHETRTQYCCCNEDGSQGCREFTVFCKYGHGSDNEEEPIWNDDGKDRGYKVRSFTLNNSILIIKDNNLKSQDNRKLYKECGLTYKTVNRRMTQSNKK